METLSYKTLKDIGYDGFLLKEAPERVLQFGDGNFLRAFAERFIDLANERAGYHGKVVLVQPHATSFERADALNAQDGLYSLYMRGRDGGSKVDSMRVISCVSRVLNPNRAADYDDMMGVARSRDFELVISNTTEAGIAYDPACRPDDRPPASFPAKLAQVLHERFVAGLPGVMILSCELIDHNGDELRRCVDAHVKQWGWEPAFTAWLDEECTFCTTLVDSIVPGGIRDRAEAWALDERAGFHDAFADVREVFDMWGIEGAPGLADRLPFKAAGLDTVFVTPDVTPYKRRKVRILNGAHTGFVPGAFLAGFDIVRDCMHDNVIRTFMNEMLDEEVIPTLVPELEEQGCRDFAARVQERFDNPFIDHQLLSICLNSVSKWRTRDLPTLLDFHRASGRLPRRLSMSLAMLLAFYTSGNPSLEEDGLHLTRENGDGYVAHDEERVLDFFTAHASDGDALLVHHTLTDSDMWGEDLTAIPGLEGLVAQDLSLIRADGALEAFRSVIG